jgi:hypothetical protein
LPVASPRTLAGSQSRFLFLYTGVRTSGSGGACVFTSPWSADGAFSTPCTPARSCPSSSNSSTLSESSKSSWERALRIARELSTCNRHAIFVGDRDRLSFQIERTAFRSGTWFDRSIRTGDFSSPLFPDVFFLERVCVLRFCGISTPGALYAQQFIACRISLMALVRRNTAIHVSVPDTQSTD